MAANLVNLESVTKAYGTRTLLDAVSLGVSEGDRIGVVGRNGDGKTTLLRVAAGVEPPDSGRVTHTGGLDLALLDQHDALPAGLTVGQVLLGGRPEHTWAGDPFVRDVLEGLLGGVGLPLLAAGPDTATGGLSGGERRRVALARALLDRHDLLMLDEPTNHLDVEAIAWLAGHLAARRGSLVVVTHDRWFLDAVCTRTWEVHGGGVHEYDGGYAAYVLAKAERERTAAGAAARRRNLLRKELAWLRRGAPARTSKPKFRIEAAAALIADEPPPRDSLELIRFATGRLGRTVFDLADVTAAVPGGPAPGAGRVLLDRLTWQVGPGDRIGLVGVNGSGKTTLLRLLTGDRAPDAGRITTGVTVRTACLSQDVAGLQPSLRVLEAVEAVRASVDLGRGRELTASQLCERFGFAGDRQWTPVGELSGGERRRLQLLRLLMDSPNVLLLDEPTNDLDIETLTALEDLLDGWAGSLIVVSHDRYFLERTTDRTVALLGDGRLRELPGGVEEYLERRRAASRAPVERAETARPGAAASAPAPGGAGSRAARKELVRLERRLERLAEQESALHREFAEHAADYARVAELDAELRRLVEEKTELEDRWLTLADEHRS